MNELYSNLESDLLGGDNKCALIATSHRFGSAFGSESQKSELDVGCGCDCYWFSSFPIISYFNSSIFHKFIHTKFCDGGLHRRRR